MWYAVPVVAGAVLGDVKQVPYFGSMIENSWFHVSLRRARKVAMGLFGLVGLIVVKVILETVRDIVVWGAGRGVGGKDLGERLVKVKDSAGGEVKALIYTAGSGSKTVLNHISCSFRRDGAKDISRVFLITDYEEPAVIPLASVSSVLEVTNSREYHPRSLVVEFCKGVYITEPNSCRGWVFGTDVLPVLLLVMVLAASAVFVLRCCRKQSQPQPDGVCDVLEQDETTSKQSSTSDRDLRRTRGGGGGGDDQPTITTRTSCYAMWDSWVQNCVWVPYEISVSPGVGRGVYMCPREDSKKPQHPTYHSLTEEIICEVTLPDPDGEPRRCYWAPRASLVVHFPSKNVHQMWGGVLRGKCRSVLFIDELLSVAVHSPSKEAAVDATVAVNCSQANGCLVVHREKEVIAQFSVKNLQYKIDEDTVTLKGPIIGGGGTRYGVNGLTFTTKKTSSGAWKVLLRDTVSAAAFDTHYCTGHDLIGLTKIEGHTTLTKVNPESRFVMAAQCPLLIGCSRPAWPFAWAWLPTSVSWSVLWTPPAYTLRSHFTAIEENRTTDGGVEFVFRTTSGAVVVSPLGGDGDGWGEGLLKAQLLGDGLGLSEKVGEGVRKRASEMQKSGGEKK